jgi:hypothetical protein
MNPRSKREAPRLKTADAQGLTALLVQHVMGWTVGPNRFLMDGRRWLPKWRFQPTKNIADALRLLHTANVSNYALHFDTSGRYRAKLRSNGSWYEASNSSLCVAVCLAIADIYGIHVELPNRALWESN